MTISKEQLIARKEEIKKDFDKLVEQIEEQELKIKSMKNNLNALAGASQQCDLLQNQRRRRGGSSQMFTRKVLTRKERPATFPLQQWLLKLQ